MLFCDRWFNPFVHDQASDRCYRLGQHKDVYVSFFDSSSSIDEVMVILNKHKSQNAKVILADGTDLGANSGGGLTYQELSGILSRAVDVVSNCRADRIRDNGPDALLPQLGDEHIDAILKDHLVSGRTHAEHEIAKARFQKTSTTETRFHCPDFQKKEQNQLDIKLPSNTDR